MPLNNAHLAGFIIFSGGFMFDDKADYIPVVEGPVYKEQSLLKKNKSIITRKDKQLNKIFFNNKKK
jgi:hypothetical protein